MNKFLGLKKEIEMNTKENLHFWNYYDEICVISIKNSDFKQIQKNLSKVGINKFKFFIFNTPKKIINTGPKEMSFSEILIQDYCDGTCQNIINNHIYIIKKYHREKKKNILILEDDIDFINVKNNVLQAKVNFLKNNNWDIFFLGYIQYPILMSFLIRKNIVKLTNPLGLQAYCLSRKGMKKILDFFSKTLDKQYPAQIDFIYNKIPNFSKYGICPSIAYQSRSPGIYKTFQEKCIPFKYILFNKLSYLFEFIGLFVPILIIIILYMIFKSLT